jgi:hypothetical protein
MHFLVEATSVVVAGLWNPSILNPGWIAHHVFDLPSGQNIPVQVEFAPGSGLPTRYGIRGMYITPSRDRLILSPQATTPDALRDVELAVKRVLEKLPHTPIQGFGYNFECLEPNPTPAQLNVFGVVADLANLDFAFETVETAVASSLSYEGRILNFTRTLSNGALKLSFNFHYPVTTAQAAAEKLRAENPAFVENLEYCRRVVRALYGLELPLPQGGHDAEQIA